MKVITLRWMQNGSQLFYPQLWQWTKPPRSSLLTYVCAFKVVACWVSRTVDGTFPRAAGSGSLQDRSWALCCECGCCGGSRRGRKLCVERLLEEYRVLEWGGARNRCESLKLKLIGTHVNLKLASTSQACVKSVELLFCVTDERMFVC